MMLASTVAPGTQEAGKGEWAATRIMQMARQLMEECRANRDLDAAPSRCAHEPP